VVTCQVVGLLGLPFSRLVLDFLRPVSDKTEFSVCIWIGPAAALAKRGPSELSVIICVVSPRMAFRALRLRWLYNIRGILKKEHDSVRTS
jgi:hypothetical protein